MKTITPTSGIELLVNRGIDHLREKTTSPDRDRDPEFGPTSPRSWRSKPRSGDYSCFQLDISSDEASSIEVRSPLVDLPNELQYMTAAYLGFGDMQRLRRTCRHFHGLLNADFVRQHFGGDEAYVRQLTSHCAACLERPGRHRLILQSVANNRAPSSKCFRCAAAARELRVGRQVPLASARAAWVCRWCGWPVAGAPSAAHEQFHVACYDGYYRVLWGFLLLGFAQFAAGVVAAALSLVYFRAHLLVLPPAVASFVLLWACMAFLVFRGNRVRTYHWVGALELLILALWVPPMYAVGRGVAEAGAGRSAVAALVFYGVNV